jgi:hypothetical protein
MSDPIRWNRVEPITRDKSLEAGLEARIHDPLWLLARQRQLGELTADADLGSAVVATVSAQVAPLTAYRPGAPDRSTAMPYDPEVAPLEALVEAESVRARPTARLRARAGLHFLRLLAANGSARYGDAYRAQYALTAADVPDADSRRFLAVVSCRTPDGARLYADLAAALRPEGQGEPALPAQPPVDPGDAAGVLRAAQAWLTWFDGLFVEPSAGGAAWVDDRLEYAFGVAAPGSNGSDSTGSVSLEADGLTGGGLDWHAFSAGATAPPPGGESTAVGPLTLVPSPVAYPGMPAQRFWEFEDAAVDFGGVEAQPEDLGRMLLTEFALVFGGDWLIVPVEAPLGSLVRIVSLDVRDTFGRTLRIGPTSALEGSLGGWRMFTLSGDGDDGLLLPPVLASRLQGRDLEEVLLLRDETANLAWAVERRIEGQNGAPVDRAQADAERNGDAAPAPAGASGTFSYRLATSVPEHWLPLLPQRTELEDPSLGLRLGALERTLSDGTKERIRPLGQLLQPLTGDILLQEEEVPREGARITRAYQLARWVDGSTFLWLARRKGVGRGEGSSGLRYDTLEHDS